MAFVSIPTILRVQIDTINFLWLSFLIYENTTIYVLFHSSPRTHMVLGIVFRLAIPD